MIITNNKIIVYASLIVGVLALAYVLEFNQVSAAQMNFSKALRQEQELGLLYQEYADVLSPRNLGDRLEKVKEEFKLERIKEFALLETGEAQLSLGLKRYE